MSYEAVCRLPPDCTHSHNQDLPALFGVASVTGLISSEGQETPVRIAFFAHCRA